MTHLHVIIQHQGHRRLQVFLCVYRMEPQIFCCRFASWDDVLAVDYTQTPDMLEKKVIEKVGQGLNACVCHVFTGKLTCLLFLCSLAIVCTVTNNIQVSIACLLQIISQLKPDLRLVIIRLSTILLLSEKGSFWFSREESS